MNTATVKDEAITAPTPLVSKGYWSGVIRRLLQEPFQRLKSAHLRGTTGRWDTVPIDLLEANYIRIQTFNLRPQDAETMLEFIG